MTFFGIYCQLDENVHEESNYLLCNLTATDTWWGLETALVSCTVLYTSCRKCTPVKILKSRLFETFQGYLNKFKTLNDWCNFNHNSSLKI